MNGDTKSLSDTAQVLSRNPLGIIALFIVLVYGLAAMVTASAAAFSPSERLPLIYFLVLFPVLVLGVFAWFVSRHSEKLYGPGDYQNEENFLKLHSGQLHAVASLTAATSKHARLASEKELDRIVERVQAVGAGLGGRGESWRNRILWVDDHPENNVYERQALEALGLQVMLALSTDDALDRLKSSNYAAIISDMERGEVPEEGYVLLGRLRGMRDRTPLFFYTQSDAPEERKQTADRGGQGHTNHPDELFEMVTRAVIQRQTA
jgi:CheY-like chemotaxis protein